MVALSVREQQVKKHSIYVFLFAVLSVLTIFLSTYRLSHHLVKGNWDWFDVFFFPLVTIYCTVLEIRRSHAC
jgi:hypothetical protein